MIIRQTRTFRKDVLKMKKRGKKLEKLQKLAAVLARGIQPDRIHKAHPLRGNWKGYIDAHVENDWILIYKIEENNLLFARTVYTQIFFKREEDFFLAIDCNKQRKRYWDLSNEKKVSIPNLFSPNAYIDQSANLGEGNVICHQAFIGSCSEIGDNNLINTSALLEHESRIGSHCHLAPKSVLAGISTLGNNCFLGAGAQIIDQVQVARGTTIGAGACLIESIISENQVYIGVPAKSTSPKE